MHLSEPLSSLVKRNLLQTFRELHAAVKASSLLALRGAESHHRQPHRVKLAMLKNSGGDREGVERGVRIADRHYADVLAAAESLNNLEYLVLGRRSATACQTLTGSAEFKPRA